MLEIKAIRALALGSALAFSLAGVAQAQRSGTMRQVSLPQGSVLRAELNDRLSSLDSRPGERFTGTIRSENDGWGLPAGTEVIGHVTAVRRATESRPGILEVDFRSLRLPDGRTYPINASLTSLDSKSVRRTSAGRLEGRTRSSNDRNKFIGYGAAAGAIIGVLTDSDILKGGLLGAAAGYLYGQLNKDKESGGRYADVNLRTGTEFGVHMDSRALVALRDDGYSRYDSRASRYDDDRADSRYSRNGDRSDSYDSHYRRNGDRYDSYDRRTSRYDDRAGTRYNGRYDDRTAGSFERYGNEVRVMLNGRQVRFPDARPFISAGRVMLPLEAVLGAAGQHYDYDSRLRQVKVWGEGNEARLTVGDSYAWVNGERMRLDTPARMVNGTLYAPTQFLEEATGMRTEWDAQSRTLSLTTRTRPSFPAYDDDFRSR